MGYITGTITSDASHVDTFISAIEAEMTLNAAWSFVSTFTAGSYTYRVWKNDGLQNSWGTDFYIALMYITAYGSSEYVYTKVFEEWDDVGKLARRGPPNPGGTYLSGPVYASYREDTWDDLGTSPTDTYHWSQSRVVTNATLFTYWALVTTDCLILSTSAGQALYAGLFDTLVPTDPLEFPLANIPFYYSNTDYGGGVTRRPDSVGTTQADQYAVDSYYTSSTDFWTQFGGVVGESVDWYPGPMGTKYVVKHTVYTYGQGARGLYKHILGFQYAAGVDLGDTITVDGAQYVFFAHGSSYGLWLDTTAT